MSLEKKSKAWFKKFFIPRLSMRPNIELPKVVLCPDPIKGPLVLNEKAISYDQSHGTTSR